ncbi:hypothetical protein EYR40_009997 [Pleurotus pulmonarius]|nr:hypothetical protein EYR36_010610 [Pleurotus pulmonarius]KAF4588446.1 hypothetical protein EYR40_009997 [Pleurotus pulmonarius]
MSSPLSPPSSIPRKSSPLNPRSLYSDSSTSSISSSAVQAAELLSPFSSKSRASEAQEETPSYNQLRTRPRGQSTSNLEMSKASLGGGGVRRPSDNFGDDRALFRGDAMATHEGERDTGIGQRLLRTNAFPTSSPGNIRGRSVSLTPQQEYAPLPDEESSGDGRTALDPPHEITSPVSSSVSVPVLLSRTRGDSQDSESEDMQSKRSSIPSILSMPASSAAKPATSFVHAGLTQPPSTEVTTESFEVVRTVGGGKGTINVPWAEARVSRPWQASNTAQKKKAAIPEEQEEGWIATRDQVARAAQSVLSTAGDITHELLEFTLEVGEFIPVPGLQTAVKTLLKIWDVLQMVDQNRMSCLGLVQDCASTVLAIRDEINDAGLQFFPSNLGDLLIIGFRIRAWLLAKSAFVDVLQLVEKLADMSFLKGYLKRDDISRQIKGCHGKLDKALDMFDRSIAVRALKYNLAAQKQSEDMYRLLERVLSGDIPIPARPSPTPGTGSPTIFVPSPTGSPTPMPGHTPLPGDAPDTLKVIQDVRTQKRGVGFAYDMADLRSLMTMALKAGSDAEMIQVLQVGRENMPEAIKALQRELEREVERERNSLPPDMAPSISGLSDGGLGGAGGGLGLSLVDADADAKPKAKLVRRVSITQVPVQPLPLRMDVDAGGDVILDDIIEGPTGGNGTGDAPFDGQLTRSRTVVSIDSERSSDEAPAKDTLDREFMESGIDALRRMSKGVETTLPSWTITQFEVDSEERIGVGYYSSVFRGNWRKRTVAIKVLHEGTSRSLFVREVEIWKKLNHPNVLKLFGASSPSAPPYFFVSAYAKNGSLVEFLKRVAVREKEGQAEVNTGRMIHAGDAGNGRRSVSPGKRSPSRRGRGSPGGGSGIGGWRMLSLGPYSSGSSSGIDSKETDLLRFMHEIAKGMEYLHRHGVVHGDLKAANVLMNDKIHCVITDFGQSEMKSEAFRMSGGNKSKGTLRWQAPEMMQGASQLSTEMDVYSFAITCVEILNMGRLPLPLMNDEAVTFFVLHENGRPPVPPSRYVTPALEELLREAWHHDPTIRPPFSKLVSDLKQIRKAFGNGGEEAISPAMSDHLELEPKQRPSPDMHPIPLPYTSPPRTQFLDALGLSPASSEAGSSFRTARDISSSPPSSYPYHFDRSEEALGSGPMAMPEPTLYNTVSSTRTLSRDPSDDEGTSPSTTSDENLAVWHYSGYDTPPPIDERLKQMRNERRYRMLLTHDFHPSLTLPLWTPSPVALGAVGYLRKPQGSFVTLFNAINPFKTAGIDMASLKGYGDFSTGKQRQDKRNFAQRKLDTVKSFFSSNSLSSRKYSFPLRAGHKSAYLCSETTQYRYFEDLDTPKKWFKANAETILRVYGTKHDIQKEDLYLVIGTLSTPNYGLFAHFNVFGAQRVRQPWGTFTTDSELPQDGGPLYHESDEDRLERQCASKVSIVGEGPWDTLIIAKLRFKPDNSEPTSL